MVETVTPEQVGMSSSRLGDLHATMQAFIDETKFSGLATLIVRHGQIVDSRCYGQLDIAANKPLRPDSLFRILSLTKPITAVATLMLYDEGRFELDDPVSQWIPAFKRLKVEQKAADGATELHALDQEITLRHLLTHTSGLGYGNDEIAPWGHGVVLQFPLPEFVQKLAQLPLVAQPGMIFNYSLAHDVLGYLIGIISGKPFDVFLRERIFEPLGMFDTSCFVSPDKLGRLGPMYKIRGEEAGLVVADELAGSPYVNPTVVPSGGGGLVSTMTDYYRFATLLAHGGALDRVRLLRESTFAEMTTNQLPASAYGENGFSAGDGYGLGVGVQVTAKPEAGLPAGAFGWAGASGTQAQIFPHEEMIVICLAQSWIDFTAGETLLKMAYAAVVD